MAVVETMRRGFHDVRKTARIIWALMLRELATRYGRDNIGFLWVAGEPLLFCGGVLIMWSLIRPPFEHGISIIPFTFTGYLPLTLLRHCMGQSVNTIKVNTGLLFHKDIKVFTLIISRLFLEICGLTIAFLIGFVFLAFVNLIEFPKNLTLVVMGWVNLSLFCIALGTIFASLAVFSEVFERFVNILSYIMIPLSGVFTMVAWLPPIGQKAILTIPVVHSVEMIRGGFFGPYVETHFDLAYALSFEAVMLFLGLILVQFVPGRVELD